MQSDKFYQIITELWPLIDVPNCDLLKIIFTNGQIWIISVTKYQVAGYVACLQRFYLDMSGIRGGLNFMDALA